MTENKKAFIELLSGNEDISKDFAEICKEENEEKFKEKFAQFANKHGLEVTAEDLKAGEDELQPFAPISDDELEAVSGGAADYSCLCAIGGGGTRSPGHGPCVCVIGGGGMDSKDHACSCMFAGSGFLDD